MIQEVFGGGSVGGTTSNAPIFLKTSAAATTAAVESRETLRCPRCESTNTKFCYYNNYNLTQPRHFCKTCRRYWTKGGTLRNVPIGGGFRKNRTPQTHPSTSSSAPKPKTTFSTQLLLNGFLDHLHHHSDLRPGPSPSPSPTLWPSLPQGHESSHILSLLRGTTHDQYPTLNPSPSPSPLSFTTLGLDPYGNGAPYPLELNGFGLGSPDIIQNAKNGYLYQRLKSSANYSYCSNENTGEVISGNVVAGSTSSSSAMNSRVFGAAPVGGAGDNLGGYGVSNSAISNSWSEFPSIPIFGAFP